MKVSIFTDASVNSQQQLAGYAFYIGWKEGKILKAGKLKKFNDDSTLAEVYCIANALYTLKHSKITDIERVWIFTDSASTVNVISEDSRGFSDKQKRFAVKEIRLLMMEICLMHGKKVREIESFFTFKHIKAHTGNQDTYSKINHWCDVNAKKYTKSKIKKAA